MKALLQSPFAWLLRREYWESRRGFLWSQVWAAGVLLVITVLSIATLEIFRLRTAPGDSIVINGSSVSFRGGAVAGTDLARMLGNALAHNAPLVGQSLAATMLGFALLGGLVLTFVVFFYLLGALYDDRRDRSILFWKSLPVSDTATVISKAVAGVILAPLLMLGVVLVAYIADQVIVTIWFAAHGLNPFPLVWAHAAPFAVWLHMLAAVPLYAVWALPTVGWLLLWSAVARSKPFLWAVAVPVVAGALNAWIALLGLPHIGIQFFWGRLVGRALLSVVPGGWVSILQVDPAQIANAPAAVRHLGSYGQMMQALAAPDTWIGAIVGIALVAVAIWFRRRREDA